MKHTIDRDAVDVMPVKAIICTPQTYNNRGIQRTQSMQILRRSVGKATVMTSSCKHIASADSFVLVCKCIR